MISQRTALLIMVCAWGLIFGENKNLLVVIPAYNNQDYVVDVLDSIRLQDYPHYKIVYIDDNSTDGSFQIVKDYCGTHCWEDKVTLIQNNTRYRKLRNLYYAIHTYATDDDIVVLVDCDDTLIGTDVLSLVNTIFQSDDVWFMYGSDKPSSAKIAQQWYIDPKGTCAPTAPEVQSSNAYRDYGWVYMHIRAFRAWLFKAIHAQDFIAQKVSGFAGQFYPACNDYAFIYPMLEMAGRHTYFNPRVVYSYNIETPLNGFKVDRSIQASSGAEIRRKKRYQPLQEPIKNRISCLDNRYDCLVISHSPDHLEKLLTRHQIPTDVDLYVLPTSITQHGNGYKELMPAGDRITLITDSCSLAGMLSTSTNKYLLIMDDSMADEGLRPETITEDIRQLEMAHAHAIYYGNLAYATRQPITTAISLFQYKHNPSIGGFSPMGTIMKKEIFIERYLALLKENAQEVVAQWTALKMDPESIGISVCH